MTSHDAEKYRIVRQALFSRSLFDSLDLRGDGSRESLARRIALNGPAYLVWDEADDLQALAALESVARRIVAETGKLLVLSLADDEHIPAAEDSPVLPSLTATIRADGSGGASRAAGPLAKALFKFDWTL